MIINFELHIHVSNQLYLCLVRTPFIGEQLQFHISREENAHDSYAVCGGINQMPYLSLTECEGGHTCITGWGLLAV